jgi:hypothetical protein
MKREELLLHEGVTVNQGSAGCYVSVPEASWTPHPIQADNPLQSNRGSGGPASKQSDATQPRDTMPGTHRAGSSLLRQ